MLEQLERSEIEFAKLKHDVRVSKSGMVLPKGLLLEARPGLPPRLVGEAAAAHEPRGVDV